MRKVHITKPAHYIIGLCLMVSMLLTGCATVYNPVTNREESTLIGEKEEIRIGREAAASLEKQYGLVKNVQLNTRLINIGKKVAQKSGRPHLPYTFKILKIKDVNALALPGGYIYVTEGLLKEVQKDAQLACVLGHEIGHVNARHGIKRVESQLGYSLIYSILLGKSDKDIKNLATLTFNLTSLGYSRQDEFQADELGIKYAYKAGYDPYGMAQFLKILKEQYKRTPSQIEVFFSTHPHVDDRIERAKETAGKYKKE